MSNDLLERQKLLFRIEDSMVNNDMKTRSQDIGAETIFQDSTGSQSSQMVY